MPNSKLEQRVSALERQVAALSANGANSPADKPWLRVQGMFSGDSGMREIFDEAQIHRENDRQKGRRPAAKRIVKRGAKS